MSDLNCFFDIKVNIESRRAILRDLIKLKHLENGLWIVAAIVFSNLLAWVFEKPLDGNYCSKRDSLWLINRQSLEPGTY